MKRYNLINERVKNGYTRRFVSEHTGINVDALRSYEIGAVENIPSNRAIALGKFFKIKTMRQLEILLRLEDVKQDE